MLLLLVILPTWAIYGRTAHSLGVFHRQTELIITIIGMPSEKMHFRLAKLALSPFGKELGVSMFN